MTSLTSNATFYQGLLLYASKTSIPWTQGRIKTKLGLMLLPCSIQDRPGGPRH